MQKVFKLCGEAEWAEAKRTGIYRGSADDVRDGFIHLSSAEQVAGTAAKYFAGRQDLLLIELDAESLGATLRFEPSRGGALFPHLYSPLDPARALRVVHVRWDGSQHDFTSLFD